METLLTAAWVAGMVEPPIRDGGVVFDGDEQLSWCTIEELLQRHPNAQRIDLSNAVILPGLINAHTHLELSSCTPGNSPTSFVDWILSMPRRIGRQPNERADELFTLSTRAGIEQCLRFGVTTVGDVSQQMHATRPVLRDSPLRVRSYGEVIGLGKRRSRFEELLPMALDESLETERLRIGLSPHSPYTLEPDAIRRCVEIADERGVDLAIHLAETPYEREFLNAHTGPLREMWDRLGSWEDFPETFAGSPVQFADACGLLTAGAILAHVNYCDDVDLELIRQSAATVVYCPRTHRYFGHPPHRWREMIDFGINVAIGTDSCASSPDLNLVDEIRLLHEMDPSYPVEKLWQLITIEGARAINRRDIPIANADFVVFDVGTDDPLRELLETNRLPKELWIGGQRIRRSPPASPC